MVGELIRVIRDFSCFARVQIIFEGACINNFLIFIVLSMLSTNCGLCANRESMCES